VNVIADPDTHLLGHGFFFQLIVFADVRKATTLSSMADRIKVLFICTANCCRSQIAEAILRHLDPVNFLALSAGSHPAGYVHPLAIAAAEAIDMPIENQHSKSWTEYADQPIDIVITVCDAAAAEVCPVWSGPAVVAHWPLADPVACPGTQAERVAAATNTAQLIKAKLERLVALDIPSLAPNVLVQQLNAIGQA